MYHFTPGPVCWRASRNVAMWCLALFYGAAVYGQAVDPAKSIKPGVVRIKVTEAYGKQLETSRMRRSSSNVLETGIEPLDRVHQQVKARSMKRLFPDGGKFEKKHRKHGLHLWYEVEMDPTVSVSSAINSYRGTAIVSRAESVYHKKNLDGTGGFKRVTTTGVRAMAAPAPATKVTNDPRLEEQWHYNNYGQSGGEVGADINLFKAWGIEAGKKEVIVAITDGGVQTDHPDLKDNMWVNPGEIPGNNIDDDDNGYVDDINGFSFVDERGKITPHPHGTHIAGTIAATNNNGVGVAGVAGGTGKGDGVRIMTCAVYKNLTPTIEIDGGWENTYIYAADNGAVISQNSWGYANEDYYEQSVLDAIKYFIEEAGQDENGNQTGPMKGGIAIFAVGNDDVAARIYPAYWEPTLAVAAYADNNKKAWYSNYGTWVDVAAPGGELIYNQPQHGVLSTLPNSDYGFEGGTSMACPHVVGVAALLVSKFGGTGYTPEMLRSKLLASADDMDYKNPDYQQMLGRKINAFHALQGDNDMDPPAAVTNLAVTASTNSTITLEWTAPSDAGSQSASYYEMRYADFPITAENFYTAMPAVPPKVGLHGTTEHYELKKLANATRYYVALRARDYFGNLSDMSNIATGNTTPAPAMALNPDAITVDAHLTETITKKLVITNNGQGELTYTIVSPEFGQLEYPEDPVLTFSRRSGKIAPAQAHDITLTFKIRAYQMIGSITENYTIVTNDPNAESATLPIQVNVQDSPPLAAADQSIDFGNVIVDTNGLRNVSVGNDGGGFVTVSNYQVDNPDFFLEEWVQDIWAGPFQRYTLKVFYKPSTTGPSQGTLTFDTDDPAHPHMSVTLRGQGMPAPGVSLNTRKITAALHTGEEVTRQITITNTGNAVLNYNMLENGLSQEKVKMLVVCPDGTGSGVPFLYTKFKEITVDVHTHLYDITLNDLLPYDVVFVMNNEKWQEAGTTADKIGDLLADYIDAGGNVIANQYSYTGDSNPSSQIGGRFLKNSYGPFLATHTFYGVGVSMEELLIPEHPLLQDVRSMTFSGDMQLVQLDAGAVGVARWSSGYWMIGAKPHVVGLNLLPISKDGQGLDDFWTGDLPQLLRNAAHWLAGSDYISVTPAQGSLAPGASATLNVKINAAALGTGHYKTAVGVASNTPTMEQVIATIDLDVQGPDFTTLSDSIVLTVARGEKGTQSVALKNNGDRTFPYAAAVKNIRARVGSPGAKSPTSMRIPTLENRQALDLEAFVQKDTRQAKPDGREAQSARASAEEAHYATSFEGYANGNINGQENWQELALSGPVWSIAGVAPASGKKHLLFTSDGSGARSELYSPMIPTGPSGKTVYSMKVWFRDPGTTFSITPLTTPSLFPVTSVTFGADGVQSARIYDEKEQFFEKVPLYQSIPQGYFQLSIEVEHATSAFRVFFDQQLAYAGIGATSTINAVVFQTSNETQGTRVYIDDISIADGAFQPLPSFLTVTPTSGSLAQGAQATLTAEADANGLRAGNYLADVVIDLANGAGQLVVPARVTVTGPAEAAITPARLEATLDYGTIGSTYFEVNNTGGETFSYQATVSADAPWMSVKPATSSVTRAAIVVGRTTLDPTGLDPGVYNGVITVTTTAQNLPQVEIPVTLTVLEPPHLEIDTDKITAQLIQGYSLTKVINLANTGISTLNIDWKKSGNSAWIGLEEATTHIAPGETRDFVVKLNATGLAAGHYQDVLTLKTNSPGSTDLQIKVDLDVMGAPHLVTSLESIDIDTDKTGTLSATVDVSNTGEAPLRYQVGGRANPNPTEYYGGPDTFGYSFIDTRAHGGPGFKWEDISGTGTEAVLDDADSLSVDLPFEFPFYREKYKSVKITSDGILGFGNVKWTVWEDRSLGYGDAPNNIIAARWQDLDPTMGGTIHYLSEPTRFIVQYTQVPIYTWKTEPKPSDLNTFQIVLYADGAIAFHYLDVMAPNSETIGIESVDGSEYLQIKDPDDWVYTADSLSIFIAAPKPWMTMAPYTDEVTTGSKAGIDLQIDIDAMAKDKTAAAVYLTSNDLENPIKRIPVNYGQVTGIGAEADAEAFSIYPVPAHDRLHVSLGKPAQGMANLAIRNAQGQLIATTQVNSAELADYTIDLVPLKLKPGVYLLQVETKPGIRQAKAFIKE